MLKRSANIALSSFEDDDLTINHHEIAQRKIYRARRPTRAVSTEHKFKIATNLLSLEQEMRLLAIDKPKTRSRTSSETSFGGCKFSAYSQLEPLKEIIQNREGVDETLGLKGFLESSAKGEKRVNRFSGECEVWGEKGNLQAICEILLEGEENWLVLKDLLGKVIVEERVMKGFVCKEVKEGEKSVLQIGMGKREVRVWMNQVLKHLFLRCFAEAKSQSFFA